MAGTGELDLSFVENLYYAMRGGPLTRYFGDREPDDKERYAMSALRRRLVGKTTQEGSTLDPRLRQLIDAQADFVIIHFEAQ